MTEGSKSSPMRIKKYGNRRLYSSTETRFVTIDEIADAVREGRTVAVTDADTRQDITAEILTQILLESRRAQHFPVEMLEQMIRLNEEAVKGFMGAYFEQSVRVMRTIQETFRSFNPFLSLLKPAPASPESREQGKKRRMRRRR